MSLALSVSDNQANTGAVATVTGTAGGAVSVFAQLVSTNGVTPSAFVLAGTRTGDGTVNMTLGLGYYWWYSIGATGGPSNLVYGPVSDSTKSVHERMILAAKAVLQGMTFAAGPGGQPPAIPAAQVYDQFTVTQQNVTFPCIVLSMETESEKQADTWTNTDRIVYPIRVGVFNRDDAQSAIANRPAYLLWRQQIFRKFRHTRLNVSECVNMDVDLNPIVDPKLPEYQMWATGLILRCYSREVRG